MSREDTTTTETSVLWKYAANDHYQIYSVLELLCQSFLAGSGSVKGHQRVAQTFFSLQGMKCLLNKHRFNHKYVNYGY